MIIPIVKHEIRQLSSNKKTWYCLAAINCLMAIIFNWLITEFLKKQALLVNSKYAHGITEEVIHPYYAWFALLVLFFIPAITTQAICAEKVNKTIINYYCAPITSTQIILGKFLALNIAIVLTMLSISIMPLSIFFAGSIDIGQYLSSVLGVYLVLSTALAIGLSISNFTNNIIRSNILIFLTLISLILFEWAAQFAGRHAMFLQNFGLLAPLKNFLSGIINIQNIIYYLFIIYSFLLMARWKFNKGAKHV